MKTHLIKVSLTAVLGLFVTLAAQAQNNTKAEKGGLFVEPGLSYQLGDTSADFPDPINNSSGENNGFGILGRFGIHASEAIFVGVDARYLMTSFKDSSVDYDAQAAGYNWGPVVGIQMPDLGLRLWGAYVAGGELDPDDSGDIDVKFTDGTGYRVGAGFRVSSVSLNLEYQKLDYDSTSLQEFGPFDPNENFDNVNFNSESWIASVSFPFEL